MGKIVHYHLQAEEEELEDMEMVSEMVSVENHMEAMVVHTLLLLQVQKEIQLPVLEVAAEEEDFVGVIKALVMLDLQVVVEMDL